MSIILLIILGLVAGLLAGLLGIGGGLVIVPVIALSAMSHFDLANGQAMHMAVATSIASILLTALGSIITHHRHGAIRWRFLLRYTPWIAAGAWLATISVEFLSSVLNGWLLIGLFVMFAFITAVKLWFSSNTTHRIEPHILNFSWPQDAFIGFLIGHLSALLGIGGGSMNAPYFNGRGVPMQVAVGTAAACGYPLALAAALGFAWQAFPGANDFNAPLLGTIHWQAALIIGISGLLAAPFGAHLAHRLPEQLLRRIFSVLLLVLAARMLWF